MALYAGGGLPLGHDDLVREDLRRLPRGRRTTVKILQGADQAALPGTVFPKDVRIEFTGTAPRGFLGLKREEHGVPGVKVKLIPAAGSELKVEPSETETDAFGRISVRVTAPWHIRVKLT